MDTLDRTLRGQLERTIGQARVLAEGGARAALEALGVGDPNAPAHLSESDRSLRRRLRAHGRQLGDSLNGGKQQTMDHLIEEVAYEHWHRMLFARFLAENQLLMYPDPSGPVAVSLQDCEDLAADEDVSNGWELAARYAGQMLPQIFRLDSPVFELKLPANHQVPLEKLLSELPVEVFTASDSLGWVYQYWQADNKDRINASEVKIGARELPAVTQLFTEPYMVSFLLDNALGAWWAARRLTEDDLLNADSEAALRQKAAIPSVQLEYLRFIKETETDGIERWTPAAGTFPGWPDHLGELKILDPCCGSGHFLVSLLLMLVPLRMELEGLSATDAVDAVLRENLHGLELDQRCVGLAAFALALNAWRYPCTGGYRTLPEMHIACSGLSVSVAKAEWKELGLGKKNLAIALDWLHDTFRHAPVLGSLLNPAKSDAAKLVQWDELSAALEQALRQESSEEKYEANVVAQGLAKATALMSAQYGWVVTNVPYLARGKQVERLRTFCEKHFPAAKNDLATVFLDRCLELCVDGGSSSVVLPQNWLFLTSYKAFREKLLKQETWNMVARMGPGAFETISGEVVKAILITLTHGQAGGDPDGAHGGLFAGGTNNNRLRGVDVSKPKSAIAKAAAMLSAEITSVTQMEQLNNPDARIVFSERSHHAFLGDLCTCIEGISTGDIPRFAMLYWEISTNQGHWTPFIQNVTQSNFFSGRSEYIRWDYGNGALHISPTAHNFPAAKMNGYQVLGNSGIRITQMGNLPVTLYTGEVFGKNGGTLVLRDNAQLPAVWAFCESAGYGELVREIDQSMAVTVGSLIKVPFDLEHWTQVAAERYPNGLPQPYTNDPTQWIFHGHPCGSVIWYEATKWTTHGPLRTDDTVLHIAVARLLGYRWPAELDANMELAAEQREWVKRCDELLPHADEDGIVCIPPVRGEASAENRLRGLLAVAYGKDWSSQVEAKLLASVGHAGKALEGWLHEKFFTQHCKLFQHRPFIWHIWDGLRDGFSVLINYHKFDRKTLETLIYTYLGDWISRQKQDIANGIDDAQEKLAAAETLKKRLELILEGESPYDIFVRWKSMSDQPIGWNPDLNDGVRLNIRPFMTVPDIKKRGAGILRDKPNIKWNKDRGKDVESAPWYPVFQGDRINDHHLTLTEKRGSRGD